MGYNPFSLEGKTILVTGASSGIGRSTAIECSKMGAKLIITARNEIRLKETLDSLDGEGHSMILCDLSCDVNIDNLVSELPEIQGLVNNAGYTQLLPINFIKGDAFEKLLRVNAVSPICLLQKALKKKKIKSGASVVFTSSLAGLGYTTPGNSMYTASKGAISSFIKNAAIELASKQIRVNAICPGMVNTGILDSGTITKEQLNADMKNYPLGRYGEPKEIAWQIINLLSDASKWITGTNVIIDGGYSIR